MSKIISDIGLAVGIVRNRLLNNGELSEIVLGDIPSDQEYTVDGETAPFYAYGHRLEIARALQLRSRDKVFKIRRYPLIALKMPFIESLNNGINTVKLNIGIFAYTDKNLSTPQRMAQIFEPTLIPLYDMFIEALRDSGLFSWAGDQEIPPHQKILRPLFGIQTEEGSDRNIFNDPLDAIEIIDLELSQNAKRNC